MHKGRLKEIRGKLAARLYGGVGGCRTVEISDSRARLMRWLALGLGLAGGAAGYDNACAEQVLAA